jgi:hypothetical protein
MLRPKGVGMVFGEPRKHDHHFLHDWSEEWVASSGIYPIRTII